ncbi:MAG: tyrosine--tRNA ligase [Candidatus Nanopelagicales bacterium]
MQPRTAVLDDLVQRELVANATDLGALREELAAGPITMYCGFDPTAPSLHMGNLAQIVTMMRFQRSGHRPLALVGGSTGLIGDPRPSSERTLNPVDIVREWESHIKAQLEQFFEFEGPQGCLLVNNFDWTKDVTAIDFLRDIGKHFSVNRMLDREAVSARLNSTGISYTEFSYQLLQSFDFLELYRRHGCTLQTGGSDQWGNITAGADLIRRVEGVTVHALTTPLVTKADGTKFGKTETGTVWLSAELTSPYAFFQFWLNADDRDLPQLLNIFSLRPFHEVAQLLAASAERPQAREGQRALAREVTALVHGAEAAEQAEAAAAALFGGGELRAINRQTLAAALLEAGLYEASRTDGALPSAIDLLLATGLSKSRSEARRTVAEGGVSVSNIKITDGDTPIDENLLIHNEFLVVRRGKKHMSGVRINA